MKNKIKVTTIKVETPKKFQFNGLFFGEPKAKNIYIYLHGLSGSSFSHVELFEKIVTKDAAVLAFNNRGSGLVGWIRQLDAREHRGFKKTLAGMAHEVFIDCVDDIDGAIQLALKMGGRNIYLLGHSTGCQKSIYYLARKSHPNVKGAILLAPLSDFADVYAFGDKKAYNREVVCARKMVASGREHDLMPKTVTARVIDAQRFLSLYTPESLEEIFSYALNTKPKLLQKVKQPLLVVLAEKDEYMERSIETLADWFDKSLEKQNHQIEIIKAARHDFGNNLDDTARVINAWVK